MSEKDKTCLDCDFCDMGTKGYYCDYWYHSVDGGVRFISENYVNAERTPDWCPLSNMYKYLMEEVMNESVKCPKCNGAGWIVVYGSGCYECPMCDGTGSITVTKKEVNQGDSNR